MNILITGCAGFIGFNISQYLGKTNNIIGVDNLNSYYSQKLKLDRLKELKKNKKFKFYKIDISKKKDFEKIFKKQKIHVVINLAAQAGVRYSIENPDAYTSSNLIGFSVILELSRKYKVNHLLAASTSSVYGDNKSKILTENLNTDHPIQYYAATKKSNEVMGHSYSHMFNMKITMLRFFTVYGPWGRPDMALFKFTKNILENKPIDVFNYGKHTRDFTYIDDIIEGIIKTIDDPATINVNWKSDAPDPATSNAPWRIYNIGNNSPVKLMDYINALEKALQKKAKINFLPLQPGDVPDTYANVDNLIKHFNYKPSTSVIDGVSKFVKWYRDYYKI